jgi:hypothetical protein
MLKGADEGVGLALTSFTSSDENCGHVVNTLARM